MVLIIYLMWQAKTILTKIQKEEHIVYIAHHKKSWRVSLLMHIFLNIQTVIIVH